METKSKHLGDKRAEDRPLSLEGLQKLPSDEFLKRLRSGITIVVR